MRRGSAALTTAGVMLIPHPPLLSPAPGASATAPHSLGSGRRRQGLTGAEAAVLVRGSLNPSTLAMLGLFGVLAPVAIYKGTVAEYHKADNLAGRPEKKFM